MSTQELEQIAHDAYKSGQTQVNPALYPMVEHVFKCINDQLPLWEAEVDLLKQVAGIEPTIQEPARVTGATQRQ